MKAQRISVIEMLIAFVLTVLGIIDGQHVTVLEKAARICMECVGIG